MGFALAAAALAASCVAISARAAAAGPLRVTDEAGRTLEIRQPVRRVVSLAPSVTETVFTLGAGGLLVGDTDFCDFPSGAKNLPHVGGPVTPNLEAIAKLHPDLVVVSRSINRLTTVQSLERLHIPVYVTDPHSVEQIVDSAERLGKVLGGSPESERAVAVLRSRLKQMRSLAAGHKPVRVFFVVWQTPLISVGRDTFLADALRWAGAESIIDTKQSWPEVSLETVVRAQPEYLLFATDEPERMQRTVTDLQSQPGWRNLNAVRAAHILILSEAINHPSPRLFDAIDQLARILSLDRARTR
jgi:iron complex transport system substrate-binding protein